jgi:flagellar motor switch protein FliM
VSTPAESLNAELHLLIPGPLLTTLVNQYFGGGALLPPEMVSRVTPSEQRIGERVSKSFFRAMDEIWSGRLPLKFGDLFVDITPDRFAMNARDTGFVVLPFLYQLGAQEAHVIRLLVPFSALDANAEFLTPKVRQQEKCELNSTWEPEIRAVLPDVTVEVRGEVFELKATLRTLLEMQVGTSIPITEPRDVKLFLGDEAIAHGIYGGFDGFKAMQFSQFRESNS